MPKPTNNHRRRPSGPLPRRRPPGRRPATKTSSARHRRLAAWLLGLAVALGPSACRKGDDAPSSATGKLAPSFQLETLEHERFYLNAQRGKPVVLLFWDTSCEVCKREMVELEALRRELGPDRVAMASICHDPENVDVARRMVGALGLGFPALLDRGGAVTAKFQVKAFPTTIVVTPDGRIGLSREGYTEPLLGQIRSTLERHLEAARHGD